MNEGIEIKAQRLAPGASISTEGDRVIDTSNGRSSWRERGLSESGVSSNQAVNNSRANAGKQPGAYPCSGPDVSKQAYPCGAANCKSGRSANRRRPAQPTEAEARRERRSSQPGESQTSNPCKGGCQPAATEAQRERQSPSRSVGEARVGKSEPTLQTFVGRPDTRKGSVTIHNTNSVNQGSSQ